MTVPDDVLHEYVCWLPVGNGQEPPFESIVVWPLKAAAGTGQAAQVLAAATVRGVPVSCGWSWSVVGSRRPAGGCVGRHRWLDRALRGWLEVLVRRAYVPARSTGAPPDRSGWPCTVPCVADVVDNGLELTRPVTVVVGENGSGKSTLVEAIAEAYGLDARGGRAGRKYTNDRPKTPLGERLRLDLTADGARMLAGAPILGATPGADVIEVGAHGLQHTKGNDLELVDHWRRYLNNPDAYLRHLI